MSKSRILTIGLRLASSDFQYQDFNSKTSLLDWDIVLFRPEIGHFFYGMEMYRGKPCLSDGASFKLKECCEHWRREINQAVEAGKTVIVFLSELEEIFVDSGRRERSGTGRNQKTTRFVDEFNNYQAIPESLIPVSATGSKMKLSSRYVEVLNSYWAEFESFSQYKVQLTDPTVPACIVTITGEKTVGAIYRNKSSPGTLLLLPYIDFDADEFTEVRDEEEFWTPEAHKFAERMLKSVVALDKALRSSRDVTPEPTWASEPEYALQIESDL